MSNPENDSSSLSVLEFHCGTNLSLPLGEIQGKLPDNDQYPQTQQIAFKDIETKDIKIDSFKQNMNNYNLFAQQNNTYVKRLDLDNFKTPKFPNLETNNIWKSNSRCLLLIGEHEDISYLAIHLAVKTLDVAENSENQESKVFIIYDITPKHANFNSLKQIHNYAEEGNNYVIATTNNSLEVWQPLLKHEDEWSQWFISKDQVLYNPDNLSQAMLTKINFKNRSLENFIAQSVDNFNITKFASIDRISKKINSILEDKKQQDELIIDELIIKEMEFIFEEEINFLKDKLKFLDKWYNFDIEDQEKLLILGIALFDGLFENQFFDALAQVVYNAWRLRDTSLISIDYYDLKKLSNRFSYEEKQGVLGIRKFKYVKERVDAKEIILRSIYISKEERIPLFEIAWINYRRQILAALEVIVDIIKQSAKDYLSDSLELYNDRVREVLTNTLSDLGLVSTGATSATYDVQRAIFKLALDSNSLVQDVAAKVITNWYSRSYNEEKRSEKAALGTLRILYSSAKQQEEALDNYLGATVALAVKDLGIVDYERKGKLSDELCNWLEELAESKNKITISYFGYFTLHYLVAKGLSLDEKLRQILTKIAKSYSYLNHLIASSLAYAYKDPQNRIAVQDILNKWYDICVNNWRNHSSNYNHNNLLSTIAITYGIVEYQVDPTLEFSEAFRRLNRILIVENQSTVCKNAIIAISRLSDVYFEKVKSELDNLASGFSGERHSQIVKELTNIYDDAAKLHKSIDDIPPDIKIILQILAIIYEIIYPNQAEGTLTVQKAFSKLYEILEREENEAIKKASIIALRILANRDFKQIEVEFKKLLSDTSYSQQNKIIDILTEIYLDQYQNNQETSVEKTMYYWIKQQDKSILQETAVKASVSFIRALKTRNYTNN